ncbi:LOW QUALITY PROTEIN: hypothetical protein Smp_134710 [Schistosoma mansoni]|uniref:hypothetical protein n=1 Tax=Schistosoma mansoni TaxID=6183 RepID=UPI00022DC577|nr:LOW QUALITY PROTEIN: hypothetical protein Smp_134710 [Schistosoma mansoni]|eukprot:XP_018651446.1 LOW QUALITY PROTEIN: hypothetical protein Smp_134710 [Schistosoma mansoni]
MLLITYLFFKSKKSGLLILKSVNETDNNANNSQLFTKSLLTTNNNVKSDNQSTNVGKQSVVHSEYNTIIQDLPIFRNVALILVGIDTSNEFSEVNGTNINNGFNDDNSVVIFQIKSIRKRTYSLSSTLPWYAWFTLPRFWLSCSTFSIMRLSVTVSVLYSGPFLLNSLKMNKSSVVSVQLVTTISCLITSVAVQRINKLLGNYIGSVVGVLFILASCTIAYFLKSADENLIAIYVSAAILGIGNTINNVRAVVVIATLIGVNQVHTAAFVHGVASFFDRILTGVFIQCIQLCVPQLTYRHIEVYIVGSLAVFGGILATIDHFIYSETVESTYALSLSCFSRRSTSSSSSRNFRVTRISSLIFKHPITVLAMIKKIRITVDINKHIYVHKHKPKIFHHKKVISILNFPINIQSIGLSLNIHLLFLSKKRVLALNPDNYHVTYSPVDIRLMQCGTNTRHCFHLEKVNSKSFMCFFSCCAHLVTTTLLIEAKISPGKRQVVPYTNSAGQHPISRSIYSLRPNMSKGSLFA